MAGTDLYIVLNDGETYTGLAGTRTIELPSELADLDEVDLFVEDAAANGEPVVPVSRVLDHALLAMADAGVGKDVADRVVSTVETSLAEQYA